jgi:hypothetical protein
VRRRGADAAVAGANPIAACGKVQAVMSLDKPQGRELGELSRS